jgi:hypothetical protein
MNDNKMWVNVPGLAMIVLAAVAVIALIHFW